MPTRRRSRYRHTRSEAPTSLLILEAASPGKWANTLRAGVDYLRFGDDDVALEKILNVWLVATSSRDPNPQISRSLSAKVRCPLASTAQDDELLLEQQIRGNRPRTFSEVDWFDSGRRAVIQLRSPAEATTRLEACKVERRFATPLLEDR